MKPDTCPLPRYRAKLAALAALASLLALACGDAPPETGRAASEALPPGEIPTQAILETPEGEIVLDLLPERAPRATSAFVRHAREGYYDGMLVHRVIPGELFQAGRYRQDGTAARALFPAVPLEPGLEAGHVAGAVSLARSTDPASGAAEFIIHARPHPELDGDYTVFARVAEGMDVVGRVVDTEVAPRDGVPGWPAREIMIERVRLR